MKKSMVIGKRHLLLAVLILALGVAVYLNWQYTQAGGAFSLTGELTSNYIGEAQYVNKQQDKTVSGTTAGSSDYFSQARSDRSAAREEGLKILKGIVNDVKADSSTVAKATQSAVQLAKDAETESTIESLVKAKGFSDCVAVISNGQVNVIVKTDGLLGSDTVQIQDIAAAQTSYELKNIKIIEVK